MKRLLAFITVLVILVGTYVSVAGFEAGGVNIKPIKDSLKLGLDLKGGVYVVLEAQTDLKGAELKAIMQQTQEVIERRVNAMGLSEPVVTIEGEDRIRVELPGAENAEEAANAIGRTAQLQFALPDGTVILSGNQVKNASITSDTQHGGFAVSLEFNSEGSKAFYEATQKQSAMPRTMYTSEHFGDVLSNAIVIVLDGQVISSPGVDEPIAGGNAIITGSFTDKEAGELAALIRGGALPVALEEVQASLIGPTLGMNAFHGSVLAGTIGIILIMVFMVVMYRVMGFAANVAVVLYVLIVLWVTIGLGAVLTLPGIAGIILSVGMAVDSNVIIFSRIQEEIVVNGKSVRVGVHAGFNRAFGTIIDTHITTIITGLLLYELGSGPVQGFAATLLIGIVASLFTAVAVTQVFVGLFAESNMLTIKPKVFHGPMFRPKKNLQIIKHRKTFYIVSIILIVAGLGIGLVRGYNLGMDFTGGSRITFDMGKQVAVEEFQKVLKDHEIEADVIYSGEDNQQISLKTQKALQSADRDALYDDIFAKFGINDSNILESEVFGPSIGEALQKDAMRCTIIAALGILIYIGFRFEWRFGLAAIIATFHDVLLMFAVYGVLHLPINAPFIASMLIIFGYSVSDTVVIFDRIRENLKINGKMKTDELIDLSVTQTVVRSLATSATTILAVTTLYVLGAPAIREFTLPLIVGIAAGAASSIFIASPIWYELVQLTGRKKYRGK